MTGPMLGRVARVYISDDDGASYDEIGRVNNPRATGTVDIVDVSSNASNGHKEKLADLSDFTLTFDMVADEDDDGQEKLWDLFLSRGAARVKVAWDSTQSAPLVLTYDALITALSKASTDAGRYQCTMLCSGGAPQRGVLSFPIEPYAYWSMDGGIVAGEIAATRGGVPIEVASPAALEAGTSPRGGNMLALPAGLAASTATISGVARPVTYGMWVRVDVRNSFYNMVMQSRGPTCRGVNLAVGDNGNVGDVFRWGTGPATTLGVAAYVLARQEANGSLTVRANGVQVVNAGITAGEAEAGTPAFYALGARDEPDVLRLRGALGDITFWSQRFTDDDMEAAEDWIQTRPFAA